MARPLVVSNTSPLITLAGVGLLDLLPAVYGEISIAAAVRDEYQTKQATSEPDLDQGITPLLTEPGGGAVAGKPQRLAENGKKSFQGSIVLGMGFVLTPEEAAALIAKDPRNREALVFPLNIPAVSRRLEETPYPYPRRLTAGRS